ncbi:hypothetical protein PYCC9005_005662 [Savitreella phatthalungensis]
MYSLLFTSLYTAAGAHTLIWQTFVNGVTPGKFVGTAVIASNDPVRDFTLEEVECGHNTTYTSKPNGRWLPAKRGSIISMQYAHGFVGDDVVDTSHRGIWMLYVAPANPVTGKPNRTVGFTKMHHGHYDKAGGVEGWDNYKLRNNSGIVNWRVPDTLPDGNYIFRTELTAMHEADRIFRLTGSGVQLYIQCTQLSVMGDEPSPVRVDGPLQTDLTFGATDNFAKAAATTATAGASSGGNRIALTKGINFPQDLSDEDPGYHYDLYHNEKSDWTDFRAPGPAVNANCAVDVTWGPPNGTNTPPMKAVDAGVGDTPGTATSNTSMHATPSSSIPIAAATTPVVTSKTEASPPARLSAAGSSPAATTPIASLSPIIAVTTPIIVAKADASTLAKTSIASSSSALSAPAQSSLPIKIPVQIPTPTPTPIPVPTMTSSPKQFLRKCKKLRPRKSS